jgi:hypothetical protein
MGWGYTPYNSAGIPALSTYEEVKAHYEKVIPIRGRTPECRPLGSNRRYKWFQVRKNRISVEGGVDNPLGTFADTYSYSFYSNNDIEFFPDDTIKVQNASWHSPSVLQFFTYSLAKIGTIDSVRGKWYFVNKMGKNFLMDNGLVLVKEGDVYVAENAVKEKRYKANRKELNAIRKKYKVFIDYGSTMLGMSPYIDRLEVAEASHGLTFQDTSLMPFMDWQNKKPDIENRRKLFLALDEFNESGDLTLLYELATYVACSGGNYAYRSQRIECSPEKFKRFFTEVLKHEYRDQLFTAEEQEVGTVFHDDNKKYFSQDRT